MRLLTLDNEDALRDHLDALNDAGWDPTVGGMDSDGESFLASLAGPYAEGTTVLYVDPWDPEVEVKGAELCNECGAQRGHRSIDDLRYPVAVIAADPEPGGSGS